MVDRDSAVGLESRKKRTSVRKQAKALRGTDAERLLHESQQRYMRLVEHIGDRFVIFSQDMTGKLLFVSGAIQSVYGVSREEVLGKTWQSAIDWLPGTVQRVEGILKAMVSMGDGFAQFENEHIHPDGIVRTTKVSISPIRDDAGLAIGFDGIVEDISEQTRLMEEISLNGMRLRLALDYAHQDWFDINFQTGELTVGPTYPVMLGYEPAEFTRSYEDWIATIHPEDLPGVLKAIEMANESGEATEVECRYKSKSGGWVWFHSLGRVYQRDEKGNPIHGIGIHTNISQRKRQSQEGADLLRSVEMLLREMTTPHNDRQADQKLSRASTRLSDQLSARQRVIIKLIANGKTSAQIAQELHISYQTVLSHRRNIARKLNLHSVAELTRFAIDSRLA